MSVANENLLRARKYVTSLSFHANARARSVSIKLGPHELNSLRLHVRIVRCCVMAGLLLRGRGDGSQEVATDENDGER